MFADRTNGGNSLKSRSSPGALIDPPWAVERDCTSAFYLPAGRSDAVAAERGDLAIERNVFLNWIDPSGPAGPTLRVEGCEYLHTTNSASETFSSGHYHPLPLDRRSSYHEVCVYTSYPLDCCSRRTPATERVVIN
jgi:hypothetical protein